MLARTVTFALLLAGCGDSCKPKEREIPHVELESMVRRQLHEKGKYTPPIYCPSGVDAQIGAKVTCYMPVNDDKYDVYVEVTGVEGTNVDLDIEVASEARDPSSTRIVPASPHGPE